MVLEFTMLEYHIIFFTCPISTSAVPWCKTSRNSSLRNLTTIKSGISLYSSKTVFFYYNLLKVVVFSHFDRILYVDYGPNRDSERRLLWEELNWVFSWWEAPLCVCVCVCAHARARVLWFHFLSRASGFPFGGWRFYVVQYPFSFSY